MTKRLSLILILAVALAAVALSYAGPAGSRESKHGDPGPHHRFGENLTKEQREAIHDKVMEMREAGASRKEIHEALREMLEGYGVELPPRSSDSEVDAATLSSENEASATWGLIKRGFK
jgi:Spy/CpxP family protein refolding chaperone